MLTLPEVLPLDRPMIGLDTETTGTNPTSSRIVELALEIYVPGKPVREYRTLINPLMPIPPGATKIHGITDAMVTSCSECGRPAIEHPETRSVDGETSLPSDQHLFKPWPTFERIADNLLKGFAGADFCGYNVRFDVRMLAAEFKRTRRVWDYEGARIVDAFRLWQIGEGRSLEDAVARWLTKEEKHELASEAHTALGDVRWATRVLAGQLKSFAQLPRDIQRLHDLCAPGWFDAEGKLQWRDGELCVSFGQHKDTPLQRIPKSYLSWMTKGDFSEKVKATCRAAIHGEYPTPPDYVAARTDDAE